MAIYRTLQLTFWTDSKITDDFTPEDKYFYLYLMTNPHTKLCGCYEISLNTASIETGYNKDTVKHLLNRMDTVHNVIRYSPETREVLLLNWHKYNWTRSEKFRKPLRNEIKAVKDDAFRDYLTRIEQGVDTVCTPSSDGDNTVSIPYQQGMDTVPIPYGYGSDTTVSVTVPVTVTDTVTDSVTDTVKQEIHYNTNTEESYNFEDITERWNELEHYGVTPIRGIRKNSKRDEAVKKLLRMFGEDEVFIAINKVKDSPFLLGKRTDFQITFDWFVKVANFQKVLEGNYRERGAGSQPEDVANNILKFLEGVDE